MTEAADDGLVFLSLATLARAIRDQKVSSREVVEAHVRRIKEVNPRIRAVVQLAEERGLTEASHADNATVRGHRTGVLRGVPITIKDSFETEGIVSTGGTRGRSSFVPVRDATVVARLRGAGAIVLGKTNTPELTIGADTDNAIHGRTNNPYDLSRSPAGSSGGAASIVASGGSPLDVGSDTGGSIREPAHVCGIAAIKPTAGRVPRTGHILPYGMGALDTLTQVGPMARYVEDLVLALPIMCGVDWVDPAIVPMPVSDPAAVDLADLRIAFYTRVGDLTPERAIEDTVRSTANALADAGMVVREDSPPALSRAGDLYTRLRNADGGAHLRRLLRGAGTVEPGPQIARRLESVTAVDGEEFARVLEAIDEFRSQMLSFVRNYDAILCPPAVNTAWLHGTTFDSPYEVWTFTTSFNLTGWPAAVVRAGTTTDGLPIGVQVVGQPWREDIVLAVAQRVESLMGGYRRRDL